MCKLCVLADLVGGGVNAASEERQRFYLGRSERSRVEKHKGQIRGIYERFLPACHMKTSVLAKLVLCTFRSQTDFD